MCGAWLAAASDQLASSPALGRGDVSVYGGAAGSFDSGAVGEIEANIGSRVSVRVDTTEQFVIKSIVPLLVVSTEHELLESAAPGPDLPIGPRLHTNPTPSRHWQEQLRRSREPYRVVIASDAATEIDSDLIPVTALDPASGRDSDVMPAGADDMKPVADRRLQRSWVD